MGHFGETLGCTWGAFAPKVGPNGAKKGPKSDSKVIPRTSPKPPKRETQTWGPYFLIFDVSSTRNHYFPKPFLARNGKRDTRRKAWKRAELCEKLGNILFGLVCNTLGLKISWHALCTQTCTKRKHLHASHTYCSSPSALIDTICLSF